MATSTKNVWQDIIKIAELFNAEIKGFAGNTMIIIYPVLGQGSAISQRIDDLMAEQYPNNDHRIKMIPSDCELIVTVKG